MFVEDERKERKGRQWNNFLKEKKTEKEGETMRICLPYLDYRLALLKGWMYLLLFINGYVWKIFLCILLYFISNLLEWYRYNFAEHSFFSLTNFPKTEIYSITMYTHVRSFFSSSFRVSLFFSISFFFLFYWKIPVYFSKEC